MRRRLAAVDDLGPPSVDNFDKRYVIECGGRRFVFDCETGAGAVCDSSNIRYMGFGAMMAAETFLRLAMPLTAERSSVEYLSRPSTVWGPPILTVDVERREVRGHEGRHRATLLARACGPSVALLVHVFPRGAHEYRARHITHDLLDELQRGLYNEAVYAEDIRYRIEESTASEYELRRNWVRGPLFDRAFVGQQEYTWGGGLGALFGRR